MKAEDIRLKIDSTKELLIELEHFIFKEKREKYIIISSYIEDFRNTIYLIEGILNYSLSEKNLIILSDELDGIISFAKENMDPIRINDDYNEIINDIDNTTLEDELYYPKESFNPDIPILERKPGENFRIMA